MALLRVGPRLLQRLQQLIWWLIYGGLLSVVLGLASGRVAPAQGEELVFWGGLATGLGVLLILVRSTLQSRDEG